MAHNVRIQKLQRFSKDGNALKGKYQYVVTCKNPDCGELGRPTSSGLAELCKVGHHVEKKQQHIAGHPHDTRCKSAPTPKRVQKKMVKLRG